MRGKRRKIGGGAVAVVVVADDVDVKECCDGHQNAVVDADNNHSHIDNAAAVADGDDDAVAAAVAVTVPSNLQYVGAVVATHVAAVAQVAVALAICDCFSACQHTLG